MNRLWVVEMLVEKAKGRKEWEPTVGCALTRYAAGIECRDWRQNNPEDKFRVRPYGPQSGETVLMSEKERLARVAELLNGIANAMAATVVVHPGTISYWRKHVEEAYDVARGYKPLPQERADG